MAYESTPARMAIRDKLVDKLHAVSAYGMITHEEIAETIGKRTSSPDAIKNAAFRIAASQSGIVFENVRGVGYRRISPGEVHRVGVQARQSIRGKAKRGAHKITAVLSQKSNSMSNGERIKAFAEVGLLGMIKLAAGRGAIKRAEEVAEAAYGKKQKPPTQEAIARSVLSALGGINGK